MAQDLLLRIHRLSRGLATKLGPLRPAARAAFRKLLALRYRRGALMQARQNDRTWWLAPEVALRGELQEFGTVQWLRSVVREGMTVIDVGANVGQLTLELAELVGPSGRVISVEPAPGNLEQLRKHVRANGFQGRVDIVAAACSDAPGTVELFVAGDSADAVGSGHTLLGEAPLRRQTNELGVHRQPVRAVTVDELCRERGLRPDVMKIDVEGAELKVLGGMSETLRGARPRLIVGFHPFAFDDAAAASAALRRVFSMNDYELKAPAEVTLGFEEYVALPRGT